MAETRRERRASMHRANAARLLAQEARFRQAERERERRALTEPDPLTGDPDAIAERNAAIRRILKGQ